MRERAGIEGQHNAGRGGQDAVDYTQSFDLGDSSIFFVLPGDSATPYNESDLFPLDFREIVLHGLTTPIDITNGSLDGSTFFAAGSYVGTLPVASGVLTAAVPEPAEFGMMTLGLGLVTGFWWLRRKDPLQPEESWFSAFDPFYL